MQDWMENDFFYGIFEVFRSRDHFNQLDHSFRCEKEDLKCLRWVLEPLDKITSISCITSSKCEIQNAKFKGLQIWICKIEMHGSWFV